MKVHCILYTVLCTEEHSTSPLSVAGIAGTLRGLLGDGDAVVRQRSAHTLGLMAGEDWIGTGKFYYKTHQVALFFPPYVSWPSPVRFVLCWILNLTLPFPKAKKNRNEVHV